MWGSRKLPRQSSRAYAVAASAASAAATASGVPTCIQMPSRRKPNSRPAAAARSNKRVSANAPGGVSANSAGERIAAPAQPPVGEHAVAAASLIPEAADVWSQQQKRTLCVGVEIFRQAKKIGFY